MGSLFSINSFFYKSSKVVYNLLVLNFLWVIFSLPVVTIGASTTALFFVVVKVIRKENYKLFLDFWRSFKLNFKQATIIFILLVFVFYFILVNLRSIYMFDLSKYFLPVQYFVLFELMGVTILVFPLLACYHLSIFKAFKMALFIANRHLIMTVLCIVVLPGIYYLIYWKAVFLLFFISIYAFWISFLLINKFALYTE